MFFVYILFSDEFGKSYIGFSQDLMKRLEEHNKGETRSTKPYVPWRIVHYDEYFTREEARKREKYLKSAAGRKWRKNNVNLGD